MRLKFLLVLLLSHYIYFVGAQTTALSNAEKAYGFSQVWSEVKYNFVYFDRLKINWDSLYSAMMPAVLEAKTTREYYDQLRKFVAFLNDGHTSVWYPAQFYKTVFAYAPVKTDLIENRVFITDVLNDTLLLQGLQPGMEIIRINGKDVHSHANALRPYESASTPQGMDFLLYNAYLLNGPVDEPLVLTVKSDKGKTKEVSVSRKLSVKTTDVISFSVKDGVGILKINGFSAPDFNSRFDKIYPELLKTNALVIDLRSNSGGNGAQGEYMLKHFFSASFPDPVITSRQINPLLKLWGFRTEGFFSLAPGYNQPFTDKTIYNKPIAVLIGKMTGSAAEDFLVPFDYLDRGIMVGQPTNGSTGQPLMQALPGGGTLRICVRKDTYPDGREFVGKGIQPDIMVADDAAAFIRGEDKTLAKAMEWLRGKTK